MKKTITLSIAAITFTLSACNNSSHTNEQTKSNAPQTFTLDTTKLKSGETFYQCEMHTEVISDKPGNCPKCGMELEKIEKKVIVEF